MPKVIPYIATVEFEKHGDWYVFTNVSTTEQTFSVNFNGRDEEFTLGPGLSMLYPTDSVKLDSIYRPVSNTAYN